MELGKSLRSRRTTVARPRGLMSLVALLAIFLQVFAVQTHVHAFSPASSHVQADGGATTSSKMVSTGSSAFSRPYLATLPSR